MSEATMPQCPVSHKLNNLSLDEKKDEADAGRLNETDFNIEMIETNEMTKVKLAEVTGGKCPRHTVGCTPHECHGALMEKEGFDSVADGYSLGKEETLKEAVVFLNQFAQENDGAYGSDGGRVDGLVKRLGEVEAEIESTGTYVQTYEELEYGCRLAWRNSGRCIMRKVSFTLHLRDSRHITTAEEMYHDILEHLQFAANKGFIKPVLTAYPPKVDGKSGPIRIWNRQLIGYAAYKRPDGSVMGDPVSLDVTAIAIKYGWVPPSDDDKSDFDLLPLIISDKETGHDRPYIFSLTSEDIVLEVLLEHPEHAAFADLNLRWYALPAISNIGVDIGGVMYQTCPFNGWYAATEIGRDILDKQRYDMAHAVSIACNIPRTTLAIWKDDVQLQVHKAILHSFAKRSISIIDHHSASNSFQEFFQEEVKARGKCPGDWVWLVPPAGGSMTSVFHQEMFNYIQKPQYRNLVAMWTDLDIPVPPHQIVDVPVGSGILPFRKGLCLYDNIIVAYGSETGTSLRYANIIAGVIGDSCIGPMPLDEVPSLIGLYGGLPGSKNLLLIATSTFGKGCAPKHAATFLPQLLEMDPVNNFDFAMLALGNSAYVNSFINFANDASDALKKLGCEAALPIKVADELKNQDEAFNEWEKALYGDSSSTVYQKSEVSAASFDSNDDNVGKKMKLTYTGSAALSKDSRTILKEMHQMFEEKYTESWESHAGTLLRSTDLFVFKAKGKSAQKLLYSDEVQPGDHIALFPKNLKDSVESVVRMCYITDYSKLDEYRERLMGEVDLCRPLRLSSIKALSEVCKHDGGKQVLSLVIANSESNSDDPNDTSNTNPTTEMLISQMPPGTVPIEWVLGHSSSMAPRFFSISSISGDEITITQSAFHFAHCNKAGTTSKWLRIGLVLGDTIEVIFSTTNFHMPEDESAPVIMIAAGSGIAPFRSFWMAKKKNPMHLFLGNQSPADVPFKSEFEQLEKNGRLTLYHAYSRGEKAQHVQDKLLEESDVVKKLLGNPATIIYVCGTPSMEYGIREKLITIIGGGIANATMALARMQVQGKYIAEVYGKPSSGESSPMGALWDECLSKTVHQASSLDRVGVPKPRKENISLKRRRRTRVSVLGNVNRSPRMRLTVLPVMAQAKSVWTMAMKGIDDFSDSDSDTD